MPSECLRRSHGATKFLLMESLCLGVSVARGSDFDIGIGPGEDLSSQVLVIAGATVDVEGLAGDESAVIADQEEAGGGDFIHLTLAT